LNADRRVLILEDEDPGQDPANRIQIVSGGFKPAERFLPVLFPAPKNPFQPKAQAGRA
jgi:hypothetical protein